MKSPGNKLFLSLKLLVIPNSMRAHVILVHSFLRQTLFLCAEFRCYLPVNPLETITVSQIGYLRNPSYLICPQRTRVIVHTRLL